MRLIFIRRFYRFPLTFLLGLPQLTATENQWDLASPGGNCGITLRLSESGRLTYQVKRRGQVILQDSPLGLTAGKHEFAAGLRFNRAGPKVSKRERYELFSGIVPKVDRLLHYRSVEFLHESQIPLTVDLAASDQGIAFRYRFTAARKGALEVMEENTGFHLPPDARGWLQPYHAAGKYTPAYEDFYFEVSPGELPPHSREKPRGWSFPALFQLPQAESWILITEVSGEDPYPACHLKPESVDGIYQIAFPWDDENGQPQDPEKSAPDPSRPLFKLPWTMPWRAILVGADAAEIATSTLVTDLAPPSRISDTSWIKPGRASWAWWSFPEGPFTEEIFNSFTDFSAGMGWEYTLLDANWWDPGLEPLIRHAASQKIAPMIWTHARDFDGAEKRRRKLDQISADGAVGLKADFWCSDRQETLETIKALFEDAAARKLLVNLHGCTLPRGWHRTWPNFMTAEAVLGAESYLYESRFTDKAAELNTVLPFTRNVAGPMDYTPVAISPKRYPRTTTLAHELATTIIFTSGIIHYGERPEVLRKLPAEALQILRDAPARWDETRCLVGEPGRLAVFARRAGDRWFIAGLNGTNDARTTSLDLAEFGNHSQRVLISEGSDSLEMVDTQRIPTPGPWQHRLPPRGGFILRLDP